MEAPLSFALSTALLCVASFACVYANNAGFTLEPIHRDSSESPFHNPQETHLQRVNNPLRRSINRVHHFDPTAAASVSPKAAESEITSASGEYLLSLSFGTPPLKVMGIADTGSDLIWTKCKPCKHCYKQVAPLFDPKSSKTYRQYFSCDATECTSQQQTSCPGGEMCNYEYAYMVIDRTPLEFFLQIQSLWIPHQAVQCVSLHWLWTQK
jgi:hypothetical protein